MSEEYIWPTSYNDVNVYAYKMAPPRRQMHRVLQIFQISIHKANTIVFTTVYAIKSTEVHLYSTITITVSLLEYIIYF